MLRMPLHPVALDLLRTVGPMAVSSANRSGSRRRPPPPRPPTNSARTSRSIWTAGPAPIGVASTVLDLTGEVPVVLRQGAVGLDRLRAVAGTVETLDG